MEKDLVSRLEETANRFVIPLHMNEGFDEQALLHLQEEIDRCGRTWRSEAVTVAKEASMRHAEQVGRPSLSPRTW